MPIPKINIHAAGGTWSVRAGGAVLGETTEALQLNEGEYPPVIYFPRSGLGMDFLAPSTTTTTCPHKGEATYYDIIAKSGPIRDAAWSYEKPHDGVARIAEHIAFDPDKVAIEQI